MKKFIKIFIIFALLIFSIMATKFYFEYQNMKQLKIQIVKEEAKSLSAFMIAFRQTYQNTFLNYKIPIDEKTIHLLPVRTTKAIGDSFSNIINHTTTIKTVSDRPRNPINQANSDELKIIKYFNENKNKDEYFKSENDEVFYYAKPLYIQKGCLKCHGKREDAIPTIRENYSTAYDYQLGELRGILSIKLSKNEIIEQINNNYQKSIMVAFTVYVLFLITIYILIRIIVRNQENYTNTLEKKIKEEVLKNQKAQEQLFKSEKLASMGEMIGNIAHQWRQPLSIISTGATGIQLQKQMNCLDDKQLDDTCNMINENAQYLSKTIDDFKNFIKGDRTKNTFYLSDEIDSVIHLVQSSISNHNINIVLDLQSNIEVNGFQNELTQCIINIFNNAKDIFKENNQEYRLLFVTTLITNNHIKIKIKDNAGGIPKDILPKIFDPYFTTKHQDQGTGLGLHMTYNLIVDGMNGQIKATNETYEYNQKEYTGAEFTISLPLQ